MTTRTPLPAPPRDNRLDAMRGVLQVFICFSHIEAGWAVYLIHKQLGFSDSSELFVFLSGLTLGSVFQRKAHNEGFLTAWRDMGQRTWALYVKHLLMFLAFLAWLEVLHAMTPGWAYFAEHTYAAFLANPAGLAGPVLLLAHQPPFIDILPLFLVLMLAMPLAMVLPIRWGWWTVAPFALLYAGATLAGWRVTTLPDGQPWTFNPLTWQLLFFLGVFLGRARLVGLQPFRRLGWLVWPAAALVIAGAIIRLSWTLGDAFGTPMLLTGLWSLMDKPNASPLLVVHALSVALVVASLVRADHPLFRHRLLQPLVWCGQRSLEVFIFGVFVSLGSATLIQVVGGGALVQLGTIALVLVLLPTYAWLLGRLRR